MKLPRKLIGILLTICLCTSLSQASTAAAQSLPPVSNDRTVYVENSAITNPFIDVATDAYYSDAVLWAVTNGITSGTSVNTFQPNGLCNRAQFVSFLWRAIGAPLPENADNPFVDVSQDAYYYNAVLWANEKGITCGTTATTFSPLNTLDRSQVVAFLYRLAGASNITTAHPFVDVPPYAYYTPAVLWAVSEGLTVGTTDVTFSPHAACTRAEAVTFLQRYFETIQKKSGMQLQQFEGMDYWLYTPKNPTPNMPLIVYLHGSSCKGEDPNVLLDSEELPAFLANGALGEVPAYVLIPQLSADAHDWISAEEHVVALIDEVTNTYDIDRSNISLTGFSMGGTGTWHMAMSYPTLFSRIAPCSGSLVTNENSLTALAKLPIWTFIGSADTAVKPQATLTFMAHLTPLNAQAHLTVFEGASHTQVPTLALLTGNYNLMAWLIGQSVASY